jgi:hypothetical protein
MRFVFTVEVEVERSEGKFESRETIGDAIREVIEGADEGSWYGENDGTYNTVDWTVTEQEPEKRQRRK